MRRLNDHEGRNVVIVGGGDSAVDWALALHPIAASVTLVHRRARFRAHEGSVRQLRLTGCAIVTDAQVEAAEGADRLCRVVVKHTSGARSTRRSRSSLRSDSPRTSAPWRRGESRSSTGGSWSTRRCGCRPGIYAAGDITDYGGKVRLISVGFGEEALAVNNAPTYLDPQRSLAPGHSTDGAPSTAPLPA